ncbi:MAG: glutamate--tRNA ligase family protein, partial [Phycisphaerae bacterium]
AKHVFLQRALGLPTPRYAHLPLVFNIDGTKMSKRDKHKAVRKVVRQRLNEETLTRAEAADIAGCAPAALDDWLKKADAALNLDQVGKLAAALNVSMPEIDVHDFRLSGYLPEALVNFIALIGWSPGDDREMLTKDELIATFSLDRINKTAGRFDRRKLLAMNTDWCARLSPERLLAAFKDWARLSGSSLESLDDATAARVLAACAGFRTFADLETKAGILFQPDDAVVYEPKAVKKFLEKGGQRGFDMLERLLPVFERAEAWSAQALDALIRDYCERQGAKLGDVAQPVRVAVAGRAVSPAIGETLALLGRERTLNRLRRCLGLRQPKT